MDTPEDIRDTYQYFTEADLTKLRANGYRRHSDRWKTASTTTSRTTLSLERRARLEQLLANLLELGNRFGALNGRRWGRN